MSPTSSGNKFLALAAALLLSILGGAFFFWFANRTPPPPPPEDNEARATESETKDGPIRFREQAQKRGIAFQMKYLPAEQGEHFKVNLYDHGCGLAIGDFDGDGHEDIYFVNQLGPNALYRNKGDGTFEDVTEKAGVALGDRVCVGAVFADYDNDGHPDLYVTSTRGGNVLFHNNGNGTFTDATKSAGVVHVGHSQTAAFFDYDNDGFLDLFVTNTAQWTLNDYDNSAHYYPGPADFWKMTSSPPERNLLYHNNGNGTFTDATAKAGLAGKGWGGDVAVFDFNDDGRLDLLVTNMFGASQLYRNDGGTFTEVTREILGRTSWGAIGSKAFDYNNDGRLDLLLVDMHSDMWLPPTINPRGGTHDNLKKKYDRVMGPFYYRAPEAAASEKRLAEAVKFRYEDVRFGNTLFEKLPSGKFAEVSDKVGLETFWPWGIAVGDFDGDGYQDVFLPSGMGHPYSYWPSSLMRNNGDGTFTDRAANAGIEPPPGGPFLEEKIGGKPAARSSRCAAVADLDGDGRLDLVVNNFNDRAFYFHNDSPRQNHVAFRLQGDGKKSNRDAVGARVTLHFGERGRVSAPSGAEVMVRQVQAAGGYLSQSSKVLHFGLGQRDKIDYAEIRWPSGRRERLDAPAINQLHVRTEGGDR